MPDLYRSRLFDKIDNWRKIDAPDEVLSWIESGTPIIFKNNPPPEFNFQNKAFKHDERLFLRSHIKRLLCEGAIKELDYVPKHVSSVKAVTKKPGSQETHRMITDLHFLNEFVSTPKFQYDSFQHVAEIVEPGDQFTSFDLKDGFFHLPLSAEASSYMNFRFENKFYRWLVCPFGWSSSPYYFHKLLRPVKRFLCLHGIKVSIFVDDILNVAKPKLITDHTDFSVNTFEDLGLRINYPKSKLEADFSIEYVGFIWDSRGPEDTPWVYINSTKLHKLIRDVKRVLKVGTIQARFLAKICGQSIAMSKAIFPAKLKLRPLYNLLSSRSSWCDILPISDSAREALLWWRDAALSWNGSPLKPAPISAQFTVDSSGYGWGAACDNLEAAGAWDLGTAALHINYKELLAILYALICFKKRLRNKTVQILSDSSTAVAYIKNMGGPLPHLSDLAETIWHYAFQQQTYLHISHLAGRLNSRSDGLSRVSLMYEWMLDPGLFRYIDKLFGPHTIDRFASMTTTQLPVYNSRYMDPLSSGVDALAQQNWGSENNFVNAPFRLLNRVLDVIIAQKAYATVIAPHWPCHAFYPKLERLAVHPPLRLKLSRHVILPLGETAEPLQNRKWMISAWRVYGGKS